MADRRFNDIASRLAAGQHGVVTRRQLLDGGVARRTIARRLSGGLIRQLHRGVYLLGPLAQRYTSEMAAVLACGPDAVLSHRSAAVLWRLLDRRLRGARVEVTLSRGQRSRPGVRVRRSRTLTPEDVTKHEQIPVTTPTRTLVDLAAVLRPTALERAVAEGVARRLVEEAALERAVARHQGARGIGKLRAVLGGTGPAFTRSTAEESLLALVRRARLVSPEVNVIVGGHEVDFFWPTERLVVEVDGRAFHSSARAFERDRRRDAELAARGIRVMRVTWKQLTREPEAVLVRLGGALLAQSPPR
jgi:very-short-patch-repair endonuclease